MNLVHMYVNECIKYIHEIIHEYIQKPKPLTIIIVRGGVE